MKADLESQIASQSKQIVLVAAISLIVLVVLSIITSKRWPKLKPWLFGGLVAGLIIPTLYMIGGTLYLNLKADSKGPVHWHVGIEFWSCGAEVNLRDPSGFLSNKVGTSTYHEHNDKFIHLEGVVVDKEHDASLGKFLQVTGGYLRAKSVGIPLSEQKSAWFIRGDQRDGDTSENESLALGPNQAWVKTTTDGPVLELDKAGYCGGQKAELQVFVYNFNEARNTYQQHKLTDPAHYILKDESSLGPPSDCLIVEYGPRRARTDKLCEQYGIKDQRRCLEFGVKKYSRDLCSAREVKAKR